MINGGHTVELLDLGIPRLALPQQMVGPTGLEVVHAGQEAALVEAQRSL